ncbi:MAG: bifunctional diaminohydroxyphosphoribosylaminopyrimidine deaminase/5-amino-6-(5-phosphoribosylamino)uracil reductase RibD [Ignavibacteria bacterium]|nr:bifunctional diaminohydroxyphosphoribosylaminopyrimidine deaminase/5-amino-6-(5-phosphoribosylamino)uracil reductase RibD [Ignavibacteria bacterium]
MRHALGLALKGTGTTSPNPRVGCVITSGATIIAEGWHQRYGEAHAEVNALRNVSGKIPTDAVMYVTLEPCSHYNKTSPCADAIIAAGIKTVVVGMIDPYPQVNGTGIARLNAFGINTRIGILEQECRWINRYFIKYVTTGLPYVILKLAQSVDGFIAPSSQQRLELTGDETRMIVHSLRSEVDAVMIGAGTVIADNPQLTVRDVGGRNPLRIVLDPRADVPLTSHFVQHARHIRTLVITSAKAELSKTSALEAAGVEILRFDDTDGEFDLVAVLARLSLYVPKPISSIMCEGGPGLATSLLNANVVDELRLHTSATPLYDGIRVDDAAVGRHWTLHDVQRAGSDVLSTYVKKLLPLIIAFFIAAESLLAVDGISLRSNQLLDTALSVMGMTKADCSVPPDLIDADPQRLPFHDTLFVNPFSAFQTVQSYQQIIRGDSLFVVSVVSQAMNDMKLGLPHIVTFNKTSKEADGTLPSGISLPKSLNLVETVILTQFLVPFIETYFVCRPLQQRWRQQQMLYDYCDSLWLITNADETKTLWETYSDDRRTRRLAEVFFSLAEPTSLQDVYRYGAAFHGRVVSLIQSLLGTAELMSDSVRTTLIETPIGRIGIGGPGNDVFEGNYAFIIDVGGDDIYRINTSGEFAKSVASQQPLNCIIDLEGNDVYLGGDFSIGTGVGGIGIVVDVAGNDQYSAGNFSIGCGLFGIGIVHDMAGDDVYSSGQNAQGAGIFGIGLLFDSNGNDVYKAYAQAQGFGATRGVGILADRIGNDNYIASSPFVDALRYYEHYTTFTQGVGLGYRPLASGGIGLLVDLAGNDGYTTDIYGQGAAYWFALGALADYAGEDHYQAYQYAQGAGIHFATGVLIDSVGNDVYVSHGVSQGCGHDVGFGLMVDESGDDSHIVESLSLGAGNANAVSIFIDAEGDDLYSTSDNANTMGYSDFRRWYGMIGVFADGGGTDRYSTLMGNNSTTTKSTYGVFVDVSAENNTVRAPQHAPEPLLELSANPDSLFIQASAAPLKYQANVQPARDSLARMGMAVLPMLELSIGTPMPRERLTLEYVFPLMYKDYQSAIDSILFRTLSSNDYDVVAQSATLAGKVKSQFVVPTLVEMLGDSSWRKRRVAAQTLGQIATSYHPQLITALSDSNSYVRARAAYSVGETGGDNALTVLIPSLTDRNAMVRYSAVEGLNRGARHSFKDIESVWKIVPLPWFPSSSMLLTSCDTTSQNAQAFAKFYGAADPRVKTVIDRTLHSVSDFWSAALSAKPVRKKTKK